MRRVLGIVGRHVAQQRLGDLDGVAVIIGDEVDVAADRGVHLGAADLIQAGGAAGDRLDDLRAGDEHVGVLPGHDDVVHQRRRVRRAPRARSGDDGDLWHHARQQHVVVEHLAVAGQRVHRFLDAGASGILEGDHGIADLQGQLHGLHDLLGVHLAQRAAHHGEILAERGDRAAIHKAGTDDHAVRREFLVGQAKVLGGVLGVRGDFLEGVRLEQGQQSAHGRPSSLWRAVPEVCPHRRRPGLWRGVPAECQAVSRKAWFFPPLGVRVSQQSKKESKDRQPSPPARVRGAGLESW
jgi:hypothetical protein